MACAKQFREQKIPTESAACFRWWQGKTRMKPPWYSKHISAVLLTGLFWMIASSVWSQNLPQAGPFPPKVPQLPTVPPPAQPPGFEVPVPRKGEPGAGVTGPKIMVKEIQVVGSTAFTPEQLAEVTAPYTNRELRH